MTYKVPSNSVNLLNPPQRLKPSDCTEGKVLLPHLTLNCKSLTLGALGLEYSLSQKSMLGEKEGRKKGKSKATLKKTSCLATKLSTH